MGKQNLLSVVVADDEQELLGAVCQLIDWEGIGFRLVGRASNGLDALQLVEELQPDFLLTDIHMPFISGTALAAQVKAVQPLIQVAFLSGYDEFEYAQQGIACEVIAYLLKPISMAQLTQELIEIHRRIEKKLSDFSAARQDSSNHQAVAAAMLLDCYFYTGAEQNRSALARMAEHHREGERGNIAPAFAQRGQGDGEDVEPVVKIGAEAALLHLGGKVAIGAGDDADVHLDGAGCAYRDDLALL